MIPLGPRPINCSRIPHNVIKVSNSLPIYFRYITRQFAPQSCYNKTSMIKSEWSILPLTKWLTFINLAGPRKRQLEFLRCEYMMLKSRFEFFSSASSSGVKQAIIPVQFLISSAISHVLVDITQASIPLYLFVSLISNPACGMYLFYKVEISKEGAAVTSRTTYINRYLFTWARNSRRSLSSLPSR